MNDIIKWGLIIIVIFVLLYMFYGWCHTEKFDMTGLLSSEVLLSKTTQPSKYSQINICELKDGNYLTTWVSSVPDKTITSKAPIIGVISDINGKIIKDEFQISTQYHPWIGDAPYITGAQVAYNKKLDVLCVGWIGIDTGTTNKICYRLFDGLGNSKTNSEAVVNFRGTDMYNAVAAVAVLGNDKFVMAYECRGNRWTIEVIGIDSVSGKITLPVTVTTTSTGFKDNRDAGRFPNILPLPNPDQFAVSRKAYRGDLVDSIAITILSYSSDAITNIDARNFIANSSMHGNVSMSLANSPNGSVIKDILLYAWIDMDANKKNNITANVYMDIPQSVGSESARGSRKERDTVLNTFDTNTVGSFVLSFGYHLNNLFFVCNNDKDMKLYVVKDDKGPSNIKYDEFKLNTTAISDYNIPNSSIHMGDNIISSYKTTSGVYTTTFNIALYTARKDAEIKEIQKKAEEEARIIAEEEAKKKAEEEAKIIAEEEAKKNAEAKIIAEEEAKKKAEIQARIIAEEEANKKAEEEAKIIAEEETKKKAEEEAKKKAEEEAKKKAIIAEEEAKKKVIAEEEATAKRNKWIYGGACCCCIIICIIIIVCIVKMNKSNNITIPDNSMMTSSMSQMTPMTDTTMSPMTTSSMSPMTMSSMSPSSPTSSVMQNMMPNGMQNMMPNMMPNGMQNMMPNGMQNMMPNMMPTGMPMGMTMTK